ncbi:MAG: hypothetical protein ACN4GW_08255 [Desulforhopalus sp.]
MKLNDPFGRMERRHQEGYITMRDAMIRGGIDTPDAAKNLIEVAKKRAITFLSVGLVICLFVILVSPSALPVALALCGFLAVWAITSARNSKRYIERFIKEELE